MAMGLIFIVQQLVSWHVLGHVTALLSSFS